MMRRLRRLSIALAAPVLMLLSILPAYADWQMNMTPGVTEHSRQVFSLHMAAFYVCVAIGVVVFGTMFYSIIKHRKSKGHKAANFHEHVGVEIVWTIIPFFILVALAYPAAKILINAHDSSEADLTIKVTGHQWKWEYEYLDNDMHFFSELSESSRLASLKNPTIKPEEVENYLLDVDNPLVIPVDKKVRFLITASDVLHSWWMPAFAVKRDAIPGFINEAWARPDTVGVYRGQCAELCGRGHAFMPIVVEVVSQDDYEKWLALNGAIPEKQDSQLTASIIPAANAQETPVDDKAFVDKGQEVLAQTATETAQAEVAETNNADSASNDDTKDSAAKAAAELDMDALMQRGMEVYAIRCTSCHQPSGDGLPNAFPGLKGEAFLTKSADEVLDSIVNGRPGTAMVAFGNQLNDNDIAAVSTYVRNAWGNDTGEVYTPDQVKSIAK